MVRSLRRWAQSLLADPVPVPEPAKEPVHVEPELVDDEVFTERHKYIEEQQVLSLPWAMFEVVGFEDDGQIKVEFNWNKPFIRHINDLGFVAETEEDSVQLFFFASQMKPLALSMVEDSEDRPVNEDLPLLSEPVNRIVQ